VRVFRPLTIIVFGLLLVVTASAQETPAEDKPEAPAYEPGKGNRSLFGDLLSAHWSLTTQLQFMSTYDDNVFLTNSFRKSAAVSNYAGRFTLAYRAKHTRFEASYLPDYSMNYRYDPLSSMSHAYTHTLRHQASPQTEYFWDFQGSYAPATGALPFKYIRFFGYTFALYSLEALEPSANILNGSTRVGMTRRLNSRTSVTANLHSSTTKFKQLRPSALPGTLRGQVFSFSGDVEVDYSLTARRSIGLTFGNTYEGLLDPGGHQHTQRIQATFKQKLPRDFSLSVAVGPSFTERQGRGDVDPGVAYDFTFGQARERMGFNITASKAFQAGLQQDSVSADTVSFNVYRKLGRRWQGSLGGAYSRSQGRTGVSNTENVSGFAQVNYQLNRSLSLFTNYRYLHQGALGGSLVRTIDRNAAAVGIAYSFSPFTGR
jgi:hypothetical protein